MITWKQLRKNIELGHPLDRCVVEPLHTVPKGWGGEVFLFHSQDYQLVDLRNEYCLPTVETVKLLALEQGKKCSLHFHTSKRELFALAAGRLKVMFVADGNIYDFVMEAGDHIMVWPGLVHQMQGLDDLNLLIEVSTVDTPEDSYRIQRGD